MTRQRRIMSAAITMAAAMGALAGCATGPYGYDRPAGPVTQAQVVGRWAEQGGDCPGAELTFAAGGTAQVEALRVVSATDPSDDREHVSGAATWSLETASGDYPENIQFQVRDQPLEADFGVDAKGLVLVVTVEDPDQPPACVYRKATAQ